MPSTRFKDLSRRISDLRIRLLPRKFEPMGFYPERIYERTRAFRVLAHAEFESFIEDRAIEVVSSAFNAWQSTGRLTPSLLAVVAYKDSVHAVPPSLQDASQKKKYPDLEARVTAAKNDFNRHLRTRNNGIREKDILKILVQIGLTDKDIDHTWMSVTDAWATSRGEAAHKSAKMQVKPDPRHELRTVREILKGFRTLDMQMEKL
jgi:hypothetical protein